MGRRTCDFEGGSHVQKMKGYICLLFCLKVDLGVAIGLA